MSEHVVVIRIHWDVRVHIAISRMHVQRDKHSLLERLLMLGVDQLPDWLKSRTFK